MDELGAAPKDIACGECGHSDRMHVKGSSPRYAGCMVKEPRVPNGRPRVCWCALTPDAARLTTLGERP